MKKWLPTLSLLLLINACVSLPPIENPFEANRGLSSGENRQSLQIYALDVGQGDATLVIGPTGKTMLIDTGPPEIGNRVVLSKLELLGIKQLDWILLTHFDLDHIGGILEVLEKFSPSGGVIDRGDQTNQDQPVYLEYLKFQDRREAMPGQTLDLGGGATAEILLVNGHYKNGRAIHLNPDEENESSIALLIRYGTFEYLTTGDLTGGGAPGGYESKDLESWLGEIAGDIDILHVGHHGSSTSTNEEFLEKIKPEEAIISVGKNNDYGHPTEEVLLRLQGIGVSVHRTDQMGEIQIKTDGANIYISTQM